MLEFYATYCDYHQLMTWIEELFAAICVELELDAAQVTCGGQQISVRATLCSLDHEGSRVATH